ncbi:MAG: (Fe-S)-binding protein [Thermodesulfobacteriota bacterium]
MGYTDGCDWTKCTRCGLCLSRCPVLGLSPAEAAEEMEKLISGAPAPRVLDSCALCFDCNRFCPEGLRPHELILSRILDARKGKTPAFLNYLFTGNPPPNLFTDLYAALSPAEKGILKRWAIKPQKTKEFLFIGCVGRVSCHDIEQSRVLAPLPKYGPFDQCCGELHYRAGSWDAFAERAEKTLADLSAVPAERMVCWCGSCYAFFSQIYPKVYGKKLPFEVTSVYHWLDERLSAGEIQVKKPLNISAAVHESCYVTELPTDFHGLLRRLYTAAGVRCAELAHNKDENLSCGAVSVARDGNIFKSMLPAQRKKYAEVKAAGVRDAALNCPGCLLTLGWTSRLYGVRLRYMPELLLQAFGDEVTRPLAGRMPMIAKTAAKRWKLLLS